MKAFITGGAGCIGSDMAGRLLAQGSSVVVYDNMSSGKAEHIGPFMENENFHFVEGDILDTVLLEKSMKGCDFVFHFAANPDIKFMPGGPTNKDLEQNTVGTYNVLEAMRSNWIKKIVFSSSSVVYGEASKIPTPEDYGPLTPISLYAASKLAGEGLITAYTGMFSFQAWIFRFANIVGPKSRKRGTMVVTDFIAKLKSNGRQMEILGNGMQEKSYMYIEDCIDGILHAIKNSSSAVNIFNLGSGDSISVNGIADITAEEMGLRGVKYTYTGDRGWLGDVRKSILSVEKMRSIGWSSKHTSEESIRRTVKEMLADRR